MTVSVRCSVLLATRALDYHWVLELLKKRERERESAKYFQLNYFALEKLDGHIIGLVLGNGSGLAVAFTAAAQVAHQSELQSAAAAWLGSNYAI